MSKFVFPLAIESSFKEKQQAFQMLADFTSHQDCDESIFLNFFESCDKYEKNHILLSTISKLYTDQPSFKNPINFLYAVLLNPSIDNYYKEKILELFAYIRMHDKIKSPYIKKILEKLKKDRPALLPKYNEYISTMKKTGTSLMIADFKLSQNGIKLLEFGKLLESGFVGFDRLNPEKPMFARIWEDFSEANAPVLFVCPGLLLRKSMRLTSEFKQENQNFFCESEKEIETFSEFKEFNTGKKKLFVMAISEQETNENLKKICAEKGLLLIDNGESYELILNDKILTSLLFDGRLENFIPKWTVLTTEPHQQQEYREIEQKLMSENSDPTRAPFIIKSSTNLSKGVGKFPARSLKQAFDFILSKTSNPHLDPESYWSKRPFDHCTVQIAQYVPSLPKEYLGKQYDDTFRSAFKIIYDQGLFSIKFYGHYRKRPVNPIGVGDERSSSISHIEENENCSEQVTETERQFIETELKKFLPEIFEKMLFKNPVATINQLLFSEDITFVVHGLRKLIEHPEYIDYGHGLRLVQISKINNPLIQELLCELTKIYIQKGLLMSENNYLFELMQTISSDVHKRRMLLENIFSTYTFPEEAPGPEYKNLVQILFALKQIDEQEKTVEATKMSA